jgi:hypothetical protein
MSAAPLAAALSSSDDNANGETTNSDPIFCRGGAYEKVAWLELSLDE